MLHEFVTANRTEIITRCQRKRVERPPTAGETLGAFGVPPFLDQLVDRLRDAAHGPTTVIGQTAAKHASELREQGSTIADVVRVYGDICQTITGLAIDEAAPITTDEFRTLNRCLDDAVACAVTEFSRLRECEDNERLGRLSHEIRDLLHRATLAFDVLQTGNVGTTGATADLVSRSLKNLGSLIDRELTQVRLNAGLQHNETFCARELVDDIATISGIDARANGLTFSVSSSMDASVRLHADRQTLRSVLGNLLQNAFKFTRSGGHVSLETRADERRVFFDVHDECGGLLAGKTEDLFRPFAQGSPDRRGLGLGLAISHDGARANGGQITITNHPGTGCVFTLDLPRQAEDWGAPRSL